MRSIKAQPLSKEAFAKYGSYQNLLDNASLGQNSVTSGGFFADLITMDFANTTLPAVSVCYVKKQEARIVSFIEAHQYTCEGLLPLDGDVVIFVGTMGWGDISPDTLEAFIIPKGTFVKLNPLIIHGTQYTVDTDEAHLVCLLPMRTFRNDMVCKNLTEGEQVEIIL